MGSSCQGFGEYTTMPESDTEAEGTKVPIQRVIYARTTANPGGHGPKKEVISPEEGEAIPEALAIDLKRLCWGGTDKTISNIWSKQGLVFKPELKLFAYVSKCQKMRQKTS